MSNREGTLEPSWRVTLDVENQLDELFATNATIHIERMTPHALWMRVNDQVVQVSSAGKLLILTEDDSEHPATEGTP